MTAFTSSAMFLTIFTRGVMSCPLGASVDFTHLNDEPCFQAGWDLHGVVVVEMEAGRAGGGEIMYTLLAGAWRVK